MQESRVGCLRDNCWGNILLVKSSSYNFDIIYSTEHAYVPSDRNRQGSTIDFFLSNMSQFISSAITINNLSSNHLPVKISINVCIRNQQFMMYDFNRANWLAFSRSINSSLILPNIKDISNSNQIDSLLESFSESVNRAVAISVPHIHIKPARKIFSSYIR